MKKAVFDLKVIITVAIIFFSTGFCRAQTFTIKGRVFDAALKTPLQNATVILKSHADRLFYKTEITDTAGAYVIPFSRAGFYTIEVAFTGHTTQVKDSVFIDEEHAVIDAIYLAIAVKDLKGVTVKAKPPYLMLKSDKIVLNIAQSPVASGGNAYDALKNAPGIIAQGDQLNFRGKSITVLINGRPSNLTGDDLVNMLNNLQASGIEKIEILPNPSSKYEATGAAVVNIILVKNKSFGTSYVLTTGIGTGKYLRANTGIDFNNRNKKTNIYGGYSFNHEAQFYKTTGVRYVSNGIISSDEEEVRKRNNNAAKLGLDYDINKKNSFGILITGYINYRDRDVTNTASLHYATNTADSVSKVFTTGRAVFKNPAVNFYYKTILDTTGKELIINADYLNYNKTWSDDFINRYYNAYGEEYINPDYLKDNSPANINVYSLTADYTLPAKKAKWEMGVKTGYTITDNDIVWQTNTGTGWKTDAGKTNHFIYKENVNAAYVNYIRSIKKWNIQTGLRIEQTNTVGKLVTIQQLNKKSYIDFFPFVQASFTKNPNNEFGFSYRKSIQRFGFEFVNPFIVYQNQYAYSKGNPDLDPQINHAFSISYSLKQSLTMGIEYSHSVKSLGVSYASQNNVTVSSYANFKGSDVGYLYLNYSKKLLQVWQMNANVYGGYFKYNVNTSSYTQHQSQNPFYGIQLSNNLVFKKGLTADCSIAYRSTLVSGIFEMKPYYYADAGLAKSFLKSKLLFKLSVSDVLNTQVIKMHTDYQGVVSDKKVKPESWFLKLTCRYSFGNKNVRSKRERQSKLSDIKNRIN
ncbi:outer membrane beta-barrel protein [Ferruginibacter sp. SUN106]|uniref:outer membrane beta-barrel protein n=1 Tax=Ferruginibacter sp. SUN106 TaxID=2978348 RepID=UPI003D35CF14